MSSTLQLIQRIRWFNLAVLTITPAIAAYGVCVVKAQRDTVAFAIAYYVFSMLGKNHGCPKIYSANNYYYRSHSG